MRAWAQQEIRDAAKALEMRTKEINGIVEAYSAGAITPEKADELHWRYQHRWGEALRGANFSDGVPDEQLLATIDQVRKPFKSPSETRERYKRIFGRTKIQDQKAR